nr:MAG TPA: hypothetical protein [Caudoviricetes sp.]
MKVLRVCKLPYHPLLLIFVCVTCLGLRVKVHTPYFPTCF